LKFHIFELKVIINKIQHRGVIGGIENRTAKLDLNSSPEFICRQLVRKIDQYVAVNPFCIAEDVISPHGVIHKLKEVFLHTLKDLPVRTLDTLCRYLDIAVQFLSLNNSRQKKEENNETIFKTIWH
jgi:hypothetical protein